MAVVLFGALSGVLFRLVRDSHSVITLAESCAFIINKA